MLRCLLGAVVVCLAVERPALAVEHVLLRRDGDEHRIDGRLLVTAEDGGLLILARDGTYWAVPPEEIVTHESDDEPFVPYTADEMAQRLLAELPEGFAVHKTRYYLVCYNTSRAYAVWCGSLFERLYMAFTNYWSRRGFDLEEPATPLIAVVFADRPSYVEYARTELGDHAERIIGYYSLRSNRMTMYDLTGVESLRSPADRRGSAAQINRLLSRPEAESTVATIIHEATHQIAFNCGLQTRYADIPLWLSEGIAVYFETPDLNSRRGWRTIGGVHRTRLAQFRRYLGRRPADSLKSLIVDDTRFRDPRESKDAYAEAWALNFFLIRQRPEQYQAYLRRLSEKEYLVYDTPEERLADFTAAFGTDLSRLDEEFLRHMNKVR